MREQAEQKRWEEDRKLRKEFREWYLSVAKNEGFMPFIFDDYEERNYNVGSVLHIGEHYYRVLDIRKSRVVCEKLIPEHKNIEKNDYCLTGE